LLPPSAHNPYPYPDLLLLLLLLALLLLLLLALLLLLLLSTLPQVVLNLDNLQSDPEAAAAFKGVDAVFCALGTTRAVSSLCVYVCFWAGEWWEYSQAAAAAAAAAAALAATAAATPPPPPAACAHAPVQIGAQL
jgi:uncharacterized BrkB/YihY/UPF0761 family membrane protein